MPSPAVLPVQVPPIGVLTLPAPARYCRQCADVVPTLGFAFGGVIAEFIGWRGSVAIVAMRRLLIAVMSYLFIEEPRRGDPLLFRPAPLITAHLELFKTPGVIFHGLTSGLAMGLSSRMR